MTQPSRTPVESRRDFLKTGAAGFAAALAISPNLSALAYAGGEEVIKVGLVGCGGRGSGAATDALDADPGVRLVALGDAFPDQLEKSLASLQAGYADRVQVDDARKFVGFDAYKGVVDSCDVVLLASPPHFRPEHLAYAVEQGKHVFCEKPVAVDAPGVRSVIESCKKAAEKKLSVVSGLCWRYHPAVKAAFEEVLSGRIGDVVAARCSYFARPLDWYPRRENWSDLEFQLRDWQYFNWLSGDHITEQHIHSIDKVIWAMAGKNPVSATGTGGRELRGPDQGDVYDHFAVEFAFDDDVTAFSRCRQQAPSLVDVTDTIYGTKGNLRVASHRVQITGENPWRYRGGDNDFGGMYKIEHRELFKSIRAGEPINNGDYMSVSTLTAILGREAAYSGQEVKWDELMKSDVRLGPATYDWNAPLPMPVPRKPGDQPARPVA